MSQEQGKVKKLEADSQVCLATGSKSKPHKFEKVSAQIQMRQPRMSVARINP